MNLFNGVSAFVLTICFAIGAVAAAFAGPEYSSAGLLCGVMALVSGLTSHHFMKEAEKEVEDSDDF